MIQSSQILLFNKLKYSKWISAATLYMSLVALTAFFLAHARSEAIIALVYMKVVKNSNDKA